MENIAETIHYTLSNRMDNAANLSLNIYSNKYINEFMDAEYASPLDYYESYRDFLKDSLYEASVGTSNYNIVMYADNPGIVNGGSFWNLDSAKDKQWYRDFVESGRDILAYPYYENTATSTLRKISIIRRMDYYHKGSCPNLVKMDMDYSGMSQSIINSKYRFLVYICDGGTILFSNDGHGGMGKALRNLSAVHEQTGGLFQGYERIRQGLEYLCYEGGTERPLHHLQQFRTPAVSDTGEPAASRAFNEGH